MYVLSILLSVDNLIENTFVTSKTISPQLKKKKIQKIFNEFVWNISDNIDAKFQMYTGDICPDVKHLLIATICHLGKDRMESIQHEYKSKASSY